MYRSTSSDAATDASRSPIIMKSFSQDSIYPSPNQLLPASSTILLRLDLLGEGSNDSDGAISFDNDNRNTIYDRLSLELIVISSRLRSRTPREFRDVVNSSLNLMLKMTYRQLGGSD